MKFRKKSNRHGVFANPSKIVGELNALEIGDANEVWPLIRELLDEISPKDYKGTRPPQKSYEKAIAGVELFAFSWWSSKCAKQMYIKFILKNERYYLRLAARKPFHKTKRRRVDEMSKL